MTALHHPSLRCTAPAWRRCNAQQRDNATAQLCKRRTQCCVRHAAPRKRATSQHHAVSSRLRDCVHSLGPRPQRTAVVAVTGSFHAEVSAQGPHSVSILAADARGSFPFDKEVCRRESPAPPWPTRKPGAALAHASPSSLRPLAHASLSLAPPARFGLRSPSIEYRHACAHRGRCPRSSSRPHVQAIGQTRQVPEQTWAVPAQTWATSAPRASTRRYAPPRARFRRRHCRRMRTLRRSPSASSGRLPSGTASRIACASAVLPGADVGRHAGTTVGA